MSSVLAALVVGGHCIRSKRQAESGDIDPDAIIRQLCADKGPGVWFRLNSGQDDCNTVAQCTSAGLQKIRCPNKLLFDIDSQSCNWATEVTNCDRKTQPRKARPLLNTDEPLCEKADQLACGDQVCIDKQLFCDGNADCNDGSDENACDMNTDPNRAEPCKIDSCQLPDCFCSEDGTSIPGGLEPSQTPQIVSIAFNGAINNNNIALFNEIFNENRLNPNGCPIKGTFFVSHKYTNYTAVQDLHARGHEIAVFSISQNHTRNYWTNSSQEQWAREMGGQRFIIEKFAGITDSSVVGMRTPYLRVGGNSQYRMAANQRFAYVSTITAPLSRIPLWPYTLSYQMPHACHGHFQRCPTRAFPVWEMVMNELDRRENPEKDDELPGCAQVDSCSNILEGEQFRRLLDNNLKRHYTTNRAPLTLNFHSAWLKDEYLDNLLVWIEDTLQKYPDVYFVTYTQTLEWIQNYPTISETRDFEPWLTKCEAPQPFPCIKPGGNNCALQTDGVPGTFNMQTCLRCPANFPWLDDPTGEGFV